MAVPAIDVEEPLRIANTPNDIFIHGANFSVRFDRQDGSLRSFVYGDHQLMAGPLEPNF